MARNGLLIDIEACIGCYTCVVACQQEHNYPEGKYGIKVTEFVHENDKVDVDYIPFTTDLCDLCARRIKSGEKTTACVKHCPAACMYYGPVAELAKMMEKKPKMVLYSPR